MNKIKIGRSAASADRKFYFDYLSAGVFRGGFCDRLLYSSIVVPIPAFYLILSLSAVSLSFWDFTHIQDHSIIQQTDSSSSLVEFSQSVSTHHTADMHHHSVRLNVRFSLLLCTHGTYCKLWYVLYASQKNVTAICQSVKCEV